mgnify:CR=1 FL=1
MKLDSHKEFVLQNNLFIHNYCNNNVHICKSKVIEGQKSLTAIDTIPINTVVFMFENSISENRTRTSIQVSKNCHIEAGNFGSFTNHSCKPNAQIISVVNQSNRTARIALITLNEVFKNQEITFDYATTETTLTNDLLYKPCLCGAVECRKIMTGFNELTDQQKELLLQHIPISEYVYKQQYQNI